MNKSYPTICSSASSTKLFIKINNALYMDWIAHAPVTVKTIFNTVRMDNKVNQFISQNSYFWLFINSDIRSSNNFLFLPILTIIFEAASAMRHFFKALWPRDQKWKAISGMLLRTAHKKIWWYWCRDSSIRDWKYIFNMQSL